MELIFYCTLCLSWETHLQYKVFNFSKLSNIIWLLVGGTGIEPVTPAV